MKNKYSVIIIAFFIILIGVIMFFVIKKLSKENLEITCPNGGCQPILYKTCTETDTNKCPCDPTKQLCINVDLYTPNFYDTRGMINIFTIVQAIPNKPLIFSVNFPTYGIKYMDSGNYGKDASDIIYQADHNDKIYLCKVPPGDNATLEIFNTSDKTHDTSLWRCYNPTFNSIQYIGGPKSTNRASTKYMEGNKEGNMAYAVNFMCETNKNDEVEEFIFPGPGYTYALFYIHNDRVFSCSQPFGEDTYVNNQPRNIFNLSNAYFSVAAYLGQPLIIKYKYFNSDPNNKFIPLYLQVGLLSGTNNDKIENLYIQYANPNEGDITTATLDAQRKTFFLPKERNSNVYVIRFFGNGGPDPNNLDQLYISNFQWGNPDPTGCTPWSFCTDPSKMRLV